MVLPVYAAPYRCHDDSGAMVLTDNPAQLHDCTMLSSQVSSGPHGKPATSEIPTVTSEATPSHAHSDNEENSHSDGQLTEDITVPLTKSGGSLVVQVLLNQERSAQLIVDTGASMTVLSTQAAIDLGILGTTDNELLTVNTAGGSVQVNMNYLPSLTVGTAQATNVAVVIHDLPDIPEHIEGLLGMSFLKHFLVTLDAEHARLILRPRQHQ
jgi:clan AA aspartic protease (TIGR02281 family)